MPRDTSGVYTLPAGSAATTGNTILASEHNTPLNDIASALTASLPVDGSKGMSGTLKIADGTAANPSVVLGSETTTGIFKKASGTLGVSSVGTEVVDFSASGIDFPSGMGLASTALRAVGAHSLIGNPTGSTAASSEITLGNGLDFSGTTLEVIFSLICPPQGRLTLTSGVPVLNSDVSAATAVLYTPYNGNLCPIYNGTTLALTSFSELTCTLDATGHLASGIYDLFVINDSGTVRLVTGPAWATATAGSGARGTGAGTTELQRQSGIWTNKVSMTGRYNSTDVTVAANKGTYVGSISIDSTAGQVTCHATYGQSRKWGVWNAYNRVPVCLKGGDSTSSWTYATAAWRAQNGSAANSLNVFQGLAEEFVDSSFAGSAAPVAGGTLVLLGVDLNLGATPSGFITRFTQPSGSGGVNNAVPPARYLAPPFLGLGIFTALEYANASTTFSGNENFNLLSATWRA